MRTATSRTRDVLYRHLLRLCNQQIRSGKPEVMPAVHIILKGSPASFWARKPISDLVYYALNNRALNTLLLERQSLCTLAQTSMCLPLNFAR